MRIINNKKTRMGNAQSKPSNENIGILPKMTRFTKAEISAWHKGFMKMTNGGKELNLEEFTRLYSKFLPFGEPKDFAKHMFRVLDKNQDGIITFDEYIYGISVVLKGTLVERLQWAFKFYDLDGDGYISKNDLVITLKAMYDAVPNTRLPDDEMTPEMRADKILANVDKNVDKIRFEDYYILAKQDSVVLQTLFLFDGLV